MIGAIALLCALSLVIGAFVPRETTEAYRRAVEETGTAPEGYEDVIDAYFVDRDPGRDMLSGIRRFAVGLAKKVLLADAMGTLANNILLTDEALSDADVHGSRVERWHVMSVYPHSASDAAGVSALLGETVTHYVDVEVSVRFAGAPEDEVWDFDLVRIDGAWYLYEIW